nr:unnamed protein product [Callosobruchus chinensis]
MVPKNKLKTYAGPSKSFVNTSVDVFNNLLAKNLSRRVVGVKKRNRKNLIKELPQRVAHTLLVDDSFHISTEDTFDKLLKNGPENSAGRTISKYSRKSRTSPVWTRSKSRCSSQIGTMSLTSETSDTQGTKRASHSYTTRSRKTSHKASGSQVLRKNGSITTSQIRSTSRTSDISDQQTNKSSSDLVLKRFQQTTIDPVYESLEVETEPVRTSIHSSSYIKIPEIQLSRANHVTADCTFPNSLLKNFKDHPVANSTPFMFDRRKKVVLKYASNTTDASDSEELLQRSFQEIQSWDEKVPDFNEPATRNSARDSCDRLPDFKGFESSRSTTSGIQQRESLVVSLEEFNQFQSKSMFNTRSNSENSNDTRFLNTMSHNEPNDFVTKRRRIASNISAVEDGLLSKKCLVAIEKCDEIVKEKECGITPESGNTSSSDSSYVSDKAFEEFFAKNHQLVLEDNNRELVVNVTNYELNDSVPITNNTISDATKDCHNENDTLETRKSEIQNGCKNVDLQKQLRINLVKQDFRNKDLAVNVTSNKFGVSSASRSTDQFTQTDFGYGFKELIVDLTLNDYDFKNEVEDEIEPNEIVDIHHSSIQETPGLQVNTGTSHDESSEIIDLTNSLHNVSKTDNRYSNRLTDFRIINRKSIKRSSKKITEDNFKDDSVKSPNKIENTLTGCISPDIFNDSIHLTDSFIVANDKELGKTLKECNMVDESVNLIESSLVGIPSPQQDVFKVPEPIRRKPVVLRSGKHWRRSLSVFRNTSLISEDAQQDDCLTGMPSDTTSSTKDLASRTNRSSVRIVPLKSSEMYLKTAVLNGYASINEIHVSRPALFIFWAPPIRKQPAPLLCMHFLAEVDICMPVSAYDAVPLPGYVPTEEEQQRDSQLREENLENSLRSLSIREATLLQHHQPVTAREIVLSRCQQTEPWKFSDCYPDSVLQHCQKIGEGVYGEVYLFRNPKGGTSVIKIIPIEGSLIVNGERQKKYEEILSEIVISMELSKLRNNTVNSTSGFTELQEVKCIQGCYPERLLDLWNLYDETKGSENECPDCFTEDQLYIVLQLGDAGKDLESFVFANAQQALAMFKQVAFALAVAEEELRFEHRDLHWGNVLLKTVEKNTKVRFTLNENVYIVPTKGIQATIIDFTLSRVEYDGVVIFNDLSLDPDLFTAEGDYQFDIYRLMQKENGNNWQNFVPYTNVLWLHYILDKSITLLRYKNPGRKLHKEYLNKLKELEEEVLNYRSVKDFVLECLT